MATPLVAVLVGVLSGAAMVGVAVGVRVEVGVIVAVGVLVGVGVIVMVDVLDGVVFGLLGVALATDGTVVGVTLLVGDLVGVTDTVGVAGTLAVGDAASTGTLGKRSCSTPLPAEPARSRTGEAGGAIKLVISALCAEPASRCQMAPPCVLAKMLPFTTAYATGAVWLPPAASTGTFPFAGTVVTWCHDAPWSVERYRPFAAVPASITPGCPAIERAASVPLSPVGCHTMLLLAVR
jgi:hypothetical protein